MATVRPSRTRSVTALWAKSALNALLFFALFMGALPALAHWALPTALPVPALLGRVVAGLLFVAGLGVWGICLDVFSRRAGGTPLPLDAPRELATTGPFAVIRNPLIAAEIAVIWSEVLWFASLGLLIYALTASVLAHLVVIRFEEPELRERFGERYDDYVARVPRWIPGRRT